MRVYDQRDRDELWYQIAEAARYMPPGELKSFVADAISAATTGEIVDMTKRLPEIDLSAWVDHEPPRRQSLWGDGWLPSAKAVMLTGAGGIGKSLFAQCLVTSIAMGRAFLGMDVVPAKCLYITCEDDADELWRRQVQICDVFGVPIADMIGRVFLVSLSGEQETALAQLNLSTGRLEPTDRWEELLGTVVRHGIRFVVFDNATDAMAGDLNDLHQVAEFVNLLTGLAMRIDGPVLLLHHPNKANADWLGSVAWHNKVRSRLIIEDGGIEGDPDARVIRNPKANYGPQGGSIAFRWHRGAFIDEASLPADDRARVGETTAAAAENKIFLECLRACTDRQQAVSISPSTTFASSIFAAMPESKGIGKSKLRAAMNRLLLLKQIETGELPWKTRDRHQARGLRETAGNAAGYAASNTCGQRGQPMPEPAEIHAGNAAERHSSLYERDGAAQWPAAPYPDEDDYDWSSYDPGND